jgi:hypothetical protein
MRLRGRAAGFRTGGADLEDRQGGDPRLARAFGDRRLDLERGRRRPHGSFCIGRAVARIRGRFARTIGGARLSRRALFRRRFLVPVLGTFEEPRKNAHLFPRFMFTNMFGPTIIAETSES